MLLVSQQGLTQDGFKASLVNAMIEESPSCGYRTVEYLLGVQALPSVAKAPNKRWTTDLCRIWTGVVAWLRCPW